MAVTAFGVQGAVQLVKLLSTELRDIRWHSLGSFVALSAQTYLSQAFMFLTWEVPVSNTGLDPDYTYFSWFSLVSLHIVL